MIVTIYHAVGVINGTGGLGGGCYYPTKGVWGQTPETIALILI